MCHPPYSPDLSPSDFHLFLALENHLHGLSFENEKEINDDLVSFFSSKNANFYREGIYQLVLKWEKAIESNGDYFV